MEYVLLIFSNDFLVIEIFSRDFHQVPYRKPGFKFGKGVIEGAK
jgi:rhamnose utilization protein RhaD (predicted bifunctional aldolase and dehydrogenase)